MKGLYCFGNIAERERAARFLPAAEGGSFSVVQGTEKVFFPEDTFTSVSGSGAAACCGYVLNGNAWAAARGRHTLEEALEALPPEELPGAQMYGAWAAVRYDARTDRLVLANDLLSKQPLYYCVSGKTLLFSTRYGEVLEGLRALGEEPMPDETGLALLLHTGSLWEDFTPCRQIRFLRPFRYLIADMGGVSERKLPMPAMDRGADRDRSIETVDALFSEAVRLQYEKNAAAGYRQLGSLSGGMDSRSLLVRAEQLGFTDDLTFTYAQPGSIDMTVAQKVAAHYRVPHLFFSMDGGGFLTDREGYFAGNEGMAVYCGSTGVLKALQSIRTDGFGLVHTAISGGEIMGDIIPIDGDGPEGDRHLGILIDACGLSDPEGVERLRKGRAEYPTFNMFRQCNDVRTNTNFMRIASTVLPAASPFLYEPLFTFMMTLPMELKRIRTFYYAWVDRKMKLPYRTTDASLPVLTGTMAERYARAAAGRIRKRIVRRSKYDMNPFDLWEKENPVLREWIRSTYEADISALAGMDGRIRDMLEKAFSGSTVEKLRALTVTRDLLALRG